MNIDKTREMLDAEARARACRPTPRAVATTSASEPVKGFQILDAATLMQTDLVPVRYVIPGWLPEGLTLLVASPKVGKSTLILQIVVALASGGKFWGEDVPKGKALVIDLETNERRLRRKLQAAGVTQLEPGAMLYSTSWPKGIFGVDAIAKALDEDPDIHLVVIDTLQRFRDTQGNKNAYAADYEALGPLQQLCRERPGLSIVAVHHTRKAASDDPIERINGSQAIAGSADNIWSLGRKGAEFILNVSGRDWERDEDEFRLIREGGSWQLSDAPRFTHSEREILSLLDRTGPLRTVAIAEALSITRQAALKRMQRMQELGQVQFKEEVWCGLV